MKVPRVPRRRPRLGRPAARPALLAAVLLAAIPLAASPAASPAAPPAAPAPQTGQPPELAEALEPDVAPESYELVDRVLAIVEEEAILLSDVEQVIGLGLVARQPAESEEELIGRVLTGLVDQRLRFQEVERFGFERVSVDLVEAQVQQIAAQFESGDAFLRRLAELELTRDELTQLIARQLRVVNYVDERLGARVFVSLEDIRAYYDRELVPTLLAAGDEPPPLEEVREDIRGLLKEQRLNDEIERWTRELRREADVRLFLDPPPPPLPPVVERYGAEPGAP
jgi:hypothetical protein